MDACRTLSFAITNGISLQAKRLPVVSRPVSCLLAIGLYAMSAGYLHAAERTGVTTKEFSISFPPKWHVETNKSDTILAGVSGEEPPFVTIYYAAEPDSQTNDARTSYKRFTNLSIADFIGSDILEAMITNSKWHSARTITYPNGTSEERLDLETGGVGARPICTFARRYHKKHVDVYFAFIADKTCEQGMPDFRKLESSITWKVQ